MPASGSRRGAPLRRSPPERFAAWLATGPLGHLYSVGADIGAAWMRWASGRLRRLARARVRARR